MSAAAEREDREGSGARQRGFALMSPRPRRASRLARMPRWVRIPVTAWAFAMFFSATLALGLLAVPLLLVTRNRAERRGLFTRRLNASLRIFSGFMRDAGLIDFWPPVLPPELEAKKHWLQLRDLLACCIEPGARAELGRRVEHARTRYRELIAARAPRYAMFDAVTRADS